MAEQLPVPRKVYLEKNNATAATTQDLGSPTISLTNNGRELHLTTEDKLVSINVDSVGMIGTCTLDDGKSHSLFMDITMDSTGGFSTNDDDDDDDSAGDLPVNTISYKFVFNTKEEAESIFSLLQSNMKPLATDEPASSSSGSSAGGLSEDDDDDDSSSGAAVAAVIADD